MNIQRAIRFLRPGSDYHFSNSEDYKNLTWDDPKTAAPTLAELQAADLPAAKAQRIARVSGEASARIYGQWPAYAQANAALGLYDSLPSTDPFHPTNLKAGIQAVVAAAHAATAAIGDLTTADAVDAFTW